MEDRTSQRDSQLPTIGPVETGFGAQEFACQDCQSGTACRDEQSVTQEEMAQRQQDNGDGRQARTGALEAIKKALEHGYDEDNQEERHAQSTDREDQGVRQGANDLGTQGVLLAEETRDTLQGLL